MSSVLPTYRPLAWQGILLQVEAELQLESVGGAWEHGELELRREGQAALSLTWMKADPRKLGAQQLLERLRPKLVERIRQKAPEGGEPTVTPLDGFLPQERMETLGLHGVVLSAGASLGCFIFPAEDGRLATVMWNHVDPHRFAEGLKRLFASGVHALGSSGVPGETPHRLWSLDALHARVPERFRLLVSDFLEKKTVWEFRKGREALILGRYPAMVDVMERTGAAAFFRQYLREWAGRYTFDFDAIAAQSHTEGHEVVVRGARRPWSWLSLPRMELRYAMLPQGELVVVVQTFNAANRCLDAVMESVVSGF